MHACMYVCAYATSECEGCACKSVAPAALGSKSSKLWKPVADALVTTPPQPPPYSPHLNSSRAGAPESTVREWEIIGFHVHSDDFHMTFI